MMVWWGKYRRSLIILLGLAYVVILPVLLVVILYLARYPILRAIGNFLVVQDELTPSDLIHTLGGDSSRVDYAVQLYQQGYGYHLFFTGNSQQAGEEALTQGIPVTAIVPWESSATSTYEEAVELKRFLDRNAVIHQVIIITSPYHTRRAQWTFRQVLGDQVRLKFAPVPTEGYPPRWWTDKLFRWQVVDEYVKIISYIVSYRLQIVSTEDYDWEGVWYRLTVPYR